MMTHANRMLCGPPDWFYVIRYTGNAGTTQELNLTALHNIRCHTTISKIIRDSCGFSRVESIHRRPGTADFVKKDYPMEISYFESLY
jgi:hypothetical protein